MSSPQPKPSSYINVTADVNFLQRIICCNHDIGTTPADTPRSRSMATEIQTELSPETTEPVDIDPNP